MPGRFIGPVQWRPLGEDRELMGAMQPLARSALGWLFNQIGDQSGVRQGIWNVNLGNGNTGMFHALAIRDLDGHCRSFVSLYSSTQGTTSEEILETIELIIRMEHGLLTLDLAALISTPDTTAPVTHLDMDTAAYYLGYGDLIPDSEPVRHAHFVGQCENNGTLVPTPDWPDGPPYVMFDNGFPYHAGLSGPGTAAVWYLVRPKLGIGGGYERIMDPHSYTGPARALVQAWMGARLTPTAIAKRLPKGWSSEAGTLGLIRDPDTKVWWVLQIGLDGLRAAALVPSMLGGVIQEWIDEISEQSVWRIQAYVLADLRATGTPITLITAKDMAPSYSGKGTETAPTRIKVCDDAWPPGAIRYGGGIWSWVDTDPHTGSLCVDIPAGSGTRYRGFERASPEFPVRVEDDISVWVKIPAGNIPYTILVACRVGTSFNYAAYWGNNNITFTGSNRVKVGEVPGTTDTWVQLAFDPAVVPGLAGKSISGWLIAIYNGACQFDTVEIIRQGDYWAAGGAESLQGGWVWSASGSRGAIVTRRTIWPGSYWEASQSATSTVKIEFVDGLPKATLNRGEWRTFRPWWGVHKLWYGVASGLSLLRHGQIFPGNDDCASNAPVLVSYSGEVLSVIYYWKVYAEVASTLSESLDISDCQGGSVRTTYSGGLYAQYGGYGAEKPEPQIIGSGTRTTRHTSVTSGTWSDWVEWDNVNAWWAWLSGPGNGGCGSNGVFYAELPEYESPLNIIHAALQLRGNYGQIVGTQDTDTVWASYGGQRIVYLVDAPDCLWSREWRHPLSGSRMRSVLAHEGLTEQEARVHWIVGNSNDPEYEVEYIASLDNATGKPEHRWQSVVQPNSRDYNAPGVQAVVTQEPDLDPPAEVDTTTTIGGASKDAPDEGWSGDLDGNGLGPASIGLFGSVSARGGSVYTPCPGAVKVTGEPWDGATPSEPTWWVGGA